MIRNFTLLFFLLAFSVVHTFAQTAGGITGKVTDAQTGEELPGTTVQLKGTTVGSVTDIYGEYLVTVPEGKQVLSFNFLGYANQEITIDVIAGTFTELNVQLSPDVLQMEEIVVTGQALGQMAAINQQINARSIVNVVSKDKIESLPDQNAAESVGRLSGVAIQREGGEGQKITVRGLSPRFNAITVNGQRLPSSDATDRSFDLSTLSADALQGIELYKSWTPNLEGDAIGGTVNFVTKKAEAGWHGKIRYLHGYNDQQEELGQHRVNADISNRFFDDKLGVLLSGNFQEADRSQDRIQQDWLLDADPNQQGQEALFLENINLEDRQETRFRYGATASVDYTLPRGDIRLFSNWSQTNRNQVRRRRRYRWDTRRQEYEILINETENSLFANTLSFSHNFPNQLKIEGSGSYSLTQIRTPYDHRIRFRENSAYNASTNNFPNINEIVALAQNDLNETFLQVADSDEDIIDFDRTTFQLDLDYPVSISNSVSGNLKAGGKVRLDNRNRDIRRFQARQGEIQDIATDNLDVFGDNSGQILIPSLLGDYVSSDFLDGDFYLGPGSGRVNGNHLDEGLSRQFLSNYLNYYQRDAFVDGGDYEVEETIYSAYIMGDFKVGDKFSVLAGVRSETTNLDYTGFSISGTAGSAEIDIDEDPSLLLTDSTANRSYTEILPSVNIKYEWTEWMDIRAAVTKTLSRPSFINMIPFTRIDLQSQTIERGNFGLEHQTSWNYDLFVSFYNKFGLLTIGGFYKEIENVDFVRRSLVTPNNTTVPEAQVGFNLIQPENSQRASIVQGIEIDFQATLTSLPVPWNGIIFSANATFIESTTYFPQVTFAPNPFRPIESDRAGTLPGQPEQVYNLSLGYETGGFSGRVSLIHQANTFGFGSESDRLGGLNTELDRDSQLDAFTQRTTRIDMAIKQKLYKGMTLFFNANNITNQNDIEFIRNGNETNRQIFGFTLDLGLEYKF